MSVDVDTLLQERLDQLKRVACNIFASVRLTMAHSEIRARRNAQLREMHRLWVHRDNICAVKYPKAEEADVQEFLYQFDLVEKCVPMLYDIVMYLLRSARILGPSSTSWRTKSSRPISVAYCARTPPRFMRMLAAVA